MVADSIDCMTANKPVNTILLVHVIADGIDHMTANTHVNTTSLVHRQKKKRKEKFTLFSDQNGSLLRRQPGASLVHIIADSIDYMTANLEHAQALDSVPAPFCE